MNTLKEIYQEVYKQAVDEGNEIHHSDKGTHHSYIDVYEELLKPYRNSYTCLLEIGVNYGYSMLTWQKYFTDGYFYGIDFQNIAKHRNGFNYIVENINNTNSILNGIGDAEFDIIIDDGSHNINDQLHALKILYPRLKSGGIYVVEDIENIDDTKQLFDDYKPEIYDNRKVKNRSDDVLVIIKK